MKSTLKTIYLETSGGLIPCQFMGWAKSPIHDVTGCFNAVVRLKRDGLTSAYRRGEVLHLPRWAVVEKAGFRSYHQLVKSAALPAIDPANLIPSREAR